MVCVLRDSLDAELMAPGVVALPAGSAPSASASCPPWPSLVLGGVRVGPEEADDEEGVVVGGGGARPHRTRQQG